MSSQIKDIIKKGVLASRPASATATEGQLYYATDNGNLYRDNGSTWDVVAQNTSGTVTSVALTVPTGLSVAGSPITNTGTLAVTENTQAANIVKAGPTSGGAATPAYRALVAADIPSLPASQIGSGTLAIARGGTNAATASANQAFMGPTSGGAVAPSFRALVAADIPKRTATTISADSTLNATHQIVLVDTSGGPVNIALPTAVGIAGKEYDIKNIGGAFAVSVAAAGAETIDTAASISLQSIGSSALNAMTIVSDGAAWWITGGYVSN